MKVRAIAGIDPAPVRQGQRSALAYRLNLTQEPALGIKQALNFDGGARKVVQAPTTGWRVVLNLARPDQ